MKKILSILNVASEDEAVEAISTFNALASDLRVVTAQETVTGAFRAAQSNATAMRQVEALTGKTGGDAVAIVTAWKAGADEATAAKAEILALKQAKTDAEATSLLDAACKAGKVLPSQRTHFEALYKDFGPKALSTALEAMGPTAPSAPNASAPPVAPPTPAAGGSVALTEEDKQIAKQFGYTNEEMLTFKQNEHKANSAA
jgi:phage I-like protein